MELPKNIVDCSVLEIARDIPKELSFYKEGYCKALKENHIYKKALIIALTGICLYVCIKMIDYANQRNQEKKKR